MEHKKWLTYWKKSLSDSLKADIDIEKLKHFEIENFNVNFQVIGQIEQVNKLIDFEEERINKKKGLSNKDSENWTKLESIQILISPFKIVPIPENLVFLKDKKSKFPFWYYATLNRKGKLLVPEECFPIFQRKFLEPLADEKTEFIFSTVEKVDQATSVGKEEYKNFEEYINYIKTLFSIAIDQPIGNYKIEGYNTIQNGIILLPDEDVNAAIGIIHLYEKVLKEKNITLLLEKFINLKNDVVNQPLSVSELIEVNFLHLGQMGFDFPISVSQRKSLYTFLQTDDKVFAVNGPPGTGKTTLLQSIVANKIVESAIKGDSPSMILACSTNNQAVTNIIDSFSKCNTKSGHLQGRWLPEIDGYATYLPSLPSEKQPEKRKDKIKEWETKKWNFRDIDNKVGLFNKVENHTYLEKAKEYFLQKSSAYFGSTTLGIVDINKKLQSE
ncbi:MAG: AAA domain-containing protein, partial [Mucilaginibacter sp.]|uniref:AAA domain-containing protein n=1 Tax=Mucilaginibacter sp. TaxID=1882438 RepID=UPI0034E3AD70